MAPRKPKVEKRADPEAYDGKKYTEEEFIEYYGKKKGGKYWKQGAPEAPAPAPKAKAKAKAKVKEAKPQAPEEPFHLTYFGVMAKGLAPALVAEMSGRPWTSTCFKDPPTEWAGPDGLKQTGKCPFGQVPLLEVPARGKMPALNIGQATAICNYISRIAKRKSGLEGDNASEYAMSAMLMAEGEDLWAGLGKNQTTIFAKEYGVGGKNTLDESKKWWAETATSHIAMLEKLLGSTAGPAFTKGGTTVGEVYLFAMLHQMKLVKSGILDAAPGVLAWYDTLKANPSISKVLDGGNYAQYCVDH
jgi:glutathione S-transferase